MSVNLSYSNAEDLNFRKTDYELDQLVNSGIQGDSLQNSELSLSLLSLDCSQGTNRVTIGTLSENSVTCSDVVQTGRGISALALRPSSTPMAAQGKFR